MGRASVLQPAEQLRDLGHEYHHVQQEHQRESDGSATRRRQRERMERIASRFERLLSHWVRNEELAAAWRRHLYDGGPAPTGPELRLPPIYRGRTATGSLVEVRRAADGDHDIFMDGTHFDRDGAPWHLEPDEVPPTRVVGEDCEEVFEASDEAVDALEAFMSGEGGGEPPWPWGTELFEDGLIDADFGLTARGRRRLSRAPARAAAASMAGGRRFCVLAADTARARLFTLHAPEPPDQPTLSPLVEVADLTSPARRARDSELLANSRPGIRSEGAPRTNPHQAGGRHPGAQTGHGVDDRRGSRRRENDRVFADAVADEVARLWQSLGDCEVIVVASPAMLGVLRPALSRRNGGPTARPVHELARDLTRLAPAALHDALAGADLLPGRGRRQPTPAVWATNGR